MITLKNYKNTDERNLVTHLAILGTLIASWIMYIQQGWVNDDSVLYFEAARLFSTGEWKSGLKLFPWPLYSLLISGLHLITGFSLHLSAQVLNAVFIFISFYSLLKLITLASGDKLTLLIASLLFVSTSYIFGDVVGMLLRDQGFWAFILTALVFFIKFYREGQLKDAIYWQVFAIISILFRIEAFTYIALLPFLLLTKPDTSVRKKIDLLLKSHILNLLVSASIPIAVLMSGSIHLNDLGRIQEIFTAFSDIKRNFTLHITEKVNIMGSDVLGEPLKKFAWSGLLMTLTLIVLSKCLLVAGLVPLILITSNYKSIKSAISSDVANILLMTAVIVIINGMLIILKVNLLSSRYVVLFGLIAIIFASFSARISLKQLKLNQLSNYSKLLLSLALVLSFVTFILNILPKHEGYNYQKLATDYVKTQNKENKKVFYVSPRARFYAGEPYLDRGYDYWDYTLSAIEDGSIYEHDYLVINLDIDENTGPRESLLKEKLTDYTLIKIIYGYKNKKRMLIYKKK